MNLGGYGMINEVGIHSLLHRGRRDDAQRTATVVLGKGLLAAGQAVASRVGGLWLPAWPLF